MEKYIKNSFSLMISLKTLNEMMSNSSFTYTLLFEQKTGSFHFSFRLIKAKELRNLHFSLQRNKIETERNLELLRKENDRLKGENASFKTEAVRTRQTLQSQEQEMKRLRKTIVLLKEKHDKQNTVVEVLSKRLVSVFLLKN